MIGVFVVFAAAASTDDMSKADSRLVMRDFANCMANSHSNDARAFVTLDPSVPLTGQQTQLLHGDCMPRVSLATIPAVMGAHTPAIAMKGGRSAYRYALAEALLLRAYPRSMPVVGADAAQLAHPSLADSSPEPPKWRWGATEWADQVKHSQQDALASAFGECVVRSSPDESWALLKTEVGSAAEDAAIKPLVRPMAACLGKTGAMARGKFAIRGTIALNFYRLTMARPATQAAR
jgi:hypothetical protein